MRSRDVRKDYAAFLRSMAYNPSRSTQLVTELSDAMHQDAVLVSASYMHNLTLDATSTQEYMNAFLRTGGWYIRPSSDAESVVVANARLKEIVVAFRGSSQNAEDWGCVKSIADGSYLKHPQFQKAAAKVRAVQYSVPKGYTLRLLGYSMGGAKATVLGEVLNISTATFNPFLPLRNVHTVNGNTVQQVYRIVNDPTTFHSVAPFKNRTFSHVMPLKDDSTLLSRVLKPHSLKQFLEASDSRPHMSVDELKRHYQRHHAFNTKVSKSVDAKLLGDARKSVLRGQSLTEYVLHTQPRGASVSSKAVQAYTAMGGRLSTAERVAVGELSPPEWAVNPTKLRQESSMEGITSIQQYYDSQVVHYDQRQLSIRTDMGKLLHEHGSFMGFALLGAYMGYTEGHSPPEKMYRSALGAVEGTLPYLSITDFVSTIGFQLLPQEKREIHQLLFGNKPAVHFEDLTKHDPVTNMLLDALPWGMERRKQDYELTIQQLDKAEEVLAEDTKSSIDPGKYVSRTSNSSTIINKATGQKFHLVSSP